VEAKKKRNTHIMTACLAGAILCMALFVFKASWAAPPDVVSKGERPEKELKAEKQTNPEKDEAKKEEKPEYVYNPSGKTDPFISFLSKPGYGGSGETSLSGRDSEQQGEELIASKEPQTELETIEIPKLTLTAVVKGKDKVWAMVIGPKGRGYFLEKGTKIGTHSGVVDDIVYDEKKTDFGVQTIRKVIIKIPYRNRNREIIYRSIEMEMPNKRS
jgi:type IV pilus assembly protein PilP